MFKPIAALVMSGVLTVTSLTASAAQADTSDDFARLLLGALVLYGIKEAVDDRNDRRASTRSVPAPKVSLRKALPQGCLLQHRMIHRENRTVFGNSCLRKNYRHYASLPDRCYRRFDTVRGTRVGWGPRCLRRAGYTW